MITVGQFGWQVHVLVGASTFFAAMCSGKFKEGQTHAAILHNTPVQVALMLMWIYSGDYTITHTQDLREWPQIFLDKLLKANFRGDSADDAVKQVLMAVRHAGIWDWVAKTHLDMYVMADKYGIKGLTTYSIDRMFECAQAGNTGFCVADCPVCGDHGSCHDCPQGTPHDLLRGAHQVLQACSDVQHPDHEPCGSCAKNTERPSGSLLVLGTVRTQKTVESE